MKKYKINYRGFTIIELLVSISIIAFLLGAFFVNYKGTNRRTELILASQNLASSIRLAQNNTMGSVEYNGVVPDGGWGVHFDLSASTKDYYVFADINQNMEMDIGEYDVEYGGRRVILPENVSFASTTVGNVLDVTFLPPAPMTNIWDGSATSTMVRIQLEDFEDTRKLVLINLFGLVEVIN